MQSKPGTGIHRRTIAVFLAAIIIISIVAGYENWVTATNALHSQWTDELNDMYLTRQNLLDVSVLLKYEGSTLDKNRTIQSWIMEELSHAFSALLPWTLRDSQHGTQVLTIEQNIEHLYGTAYCMFILNSTERVSLANLLSYIGYNLTGAYSSNYTLPIGQPGIPLFYSGQPPPNESILLLTVNMSKTLSNYYSCGV